MIKPSHLSGLFVLFIHPISVILSVGKRHQKNESLITNAAMNRSKVTVMKYLSIILLATGCILFPILFFSGCNVNDSVVDDNTLEINLTGKIINGETGKTVADAIISAHKRFGTGEERDNQDNFQRLKISTGDYGDYSVKGLINNCRVNDRAGHIRAEATDSAGKFLSYTTAFKCTEDPQSINLVLRRPDLFRKLIIK